MHKFIKLDPIQLNGIEFLRNHKNTILSLYTGLGKSKTVLYWLRDFIPPTKRVVFIVPKSILVRWVAEVEETLGPDRLVHVISFGMIYQFASFIEHADVLILDEPKLLKNRYNQIYVALTSIRRPYRQVRVLLDATPLENSRNELEALADFLGIDDVRSLPDCIYPTCSTENKPARPTELRRLKIAPPNRKFSAAVKFSEMELARTLLPKVKSVPRANAAIGRALSLLNGFSKGEYGPHKLDVLLDFIGNQPPGASGVICVTRKDAMDAIHDGLWKTLSIPAAQFHGGLTAKQRQGVVDDFEAGKYQWVVATKAGERGLNLRRGEYVVHFDLPWAGSSFTQRDRVTRRDSDLTKTTKIIVLMFADTVEELVYRKLRAKIQMNRSLLDGVVTNVWTTTWRDFLVDKWERIHKLDLEEVLR